MKKDFLEVLLGNAARSRILRFFCTGSAVVAAIEEVCKKTRVTRKNARRELAALKKIGILSVKGPAWSLNSGYVHVPALVQFVQGVAPMKHEGIVSGLKGVGRLTAIVISGTFLGDVTRPADLIIVGDALHGNRIDRAVRALENAWGREIRYAAFPTTEFRYRLTIQDRLLRDVLDFPHRVLLDRTNLLA